MTHTKYTGKGKLVFKGKTLTKSDLLDLLRALFPKFQCMYGNKLDKSFLVYVLYRILPFNDVAARLFTPDEIKELYNTLRMWYRLNVENRG